MKKLLVLFTICILLFTACSVTDEVSAVVEQYEEKIKLYEEKIEHLQNELSNKDDELEKLREKVMDLEKANEMLCYLSTESEEFSWMNGRNWDSIIVTVRENDNYNCTLSGELLEVSPRDLFGAIRAGYAPPTPSSYTENYQYIFKKGNEEYVVEVYNPNLIKYNGNFYECTKNASALGEAVLYYPKEIPEASLIRKIYESKIWGYNTDLFRIRQIACLIQRFIDEGTVVKIKKPEPKDVEVTENLVEMNFYNKGQMITVILDKSYICIKHDEKEEWYKAVNDADLISNYWSAMTAN